ncbi:Integrin beta-1-binding protein 1 [Chelonia mydas]|uniref:Integrin beta-1-binding protein 1 n=1 Tax=Chelonia mydas TaxID=8469 RepID=M7BXS1_CHEMY|nr:Integrin beta-1-binding protein 1 [Chelonia mydas]
MPEDFADREDEEDDDDELKESTQHTILPNSQDLFITLTEISSQPNQAGEGTSGQSNSNSDTCAEFRVKYVGAIEKLKLDESKSLEGPLDLINYIDVAQQDGKLPFVPVEEEFIMGVSKYGIKVSTSDQYDVLHRHALYLIVRMVCYDDGLGAGKSLLALKTTDASYEEYSLWVYQCNSLVRIHVYGS